MLIGISGKKGSGKDTVGQIIQYLTLNDKRCFEFNEDCLLKWIKDRKLRDSWLTSDDWQIHKFADSLKEIVCILIGCQREQLEDQKFKESYLEEEWDVRKSCFQVLDKCDKQELGLEEYVSKEMVCPENCSPYIIESKFTVREFMQTLGNDILKKLHPNVWINALFQHDNYDEFHNWIITDCRFPNEAQTIKNRRGILIRVNKYNDIKDTHKTETSLDGYEFDYIINNDGTIHELLEEVRNILIKENIIEQ